MLEGASPVARGGIPEESPQHEECEDCGFFSLKIQVPREYRLEAEVSKHALESRYGGHGRKNTIRNKAKVYEQ